MKDPEVTTQQPREGGVLLRNTRRAAGSGQWAVGSRLGVGVGVGVGVGAGENRYETGRTAMRHIQSILTHPLDVVRLVFLPLFDDDKVRFAPAKDAEPYRAEILHFLADVHGFFRVFYGFAVD